MRTPIGGKSITPTPAAYSREAERFSTMWLPRRPTAYSLPLLYFVSRFSYCTGFTSRLHVTVATSSRSPSAVSTSTLDYGRMCGRTRSWDVANSRGITPSRSRQRRPILSCSLEELRTVQQERGGTVGDTTYDNGHVCGRVLLSGFEAGLGSRQRAEAVDKAAQSATLLMDKSHWGILRVEGQDRLRFLHSQGTNAFEDASNGSVVSTCFTSNVGRVVDFCEGVVLEDEVLLLSSPHRWQRLLQNMDKFIFPMDKTIVSTLSEERAVFSLSGPQAADTLRLVQCPSVPPPGRFVEWDFDGEKVVVIGHARSMNGGQAARNGGNDGGDDGARSESSEETYISLIVPMAVSPKLWSGLADSPGVVAAGEEEWQTFRIKRGFPLAGKELTNDYNPLEAGLWHSVHFDKGCYIGQESISRVNAYNAVRTCLHGVSFENPGVSEGEVLVVEETGKNAGVVTSMMNQDAGHGPHGLAYIKTQAGGIGLKVATKDGIQGTVTQVPYPTRSDAESAMPPVKKKESQDETQAAAASLGLEDEKAKEAARKAAKLEAMQKKLDALKARRNAA